MAKITQYPAKTVPSNNDEFVLHDPSSGSTKKMARGDLIGGAPLPANSVDTQAIIGLTPQTAANSGSGGGTWTYWSVGDMKFASITSVSRSMSGGAGTSSDFVPPSGFFSSIVAVQSNMVELTSDARQASSVAIVSTSNIRTASWTTNITGSATGKVSLTVIGR